MLCAVLPLTQCRHRFPSDCKPRPCHKCDTINDKESRPTKVRQDSEHGLDHTPFISRIRSDSISSSTTGTYCATAEKEHHQDACPTPSAFPVAHSGVWPQAYHSSPDYLTVNKEQEKLKKIGVPEDSNVVHHPLSDYYALYITLYSTL